MHGLLSSSQFKSQVNILNKYIIFFNCILRVKCCATYHRHNVYVLFRKITKAIDPVTTLYQRQHDVKVSFYLSKYGPNNEKHSYRIESFKS